jgi:hypothetical protein
MLQKESGGFRQKAAFFNFQSFAALCRDAATLDVHVPKMSLLTELENHFVLVLQSPHPRLGLVMEETSLAQRWLPQWLALVSASYGPLINGACMPVTKLGPKFLG